MVIAPDFEILQVVVVQDAVIHTFTGGTFTVDGFVLFTVPWNTGMKPEVGAVLYIDSPSIAAFAAGLRVTAKGICMCFYGSTITRDSKFLKRDEAINYRRKDSGERKNSLENVLFSIREGLTMKDAFHHIP